ncbi:MAG: hypothetical protein IIX54_03865 [Clostridia bacterium]|nr:hypothetical protein [Clostridia bacterium]
MSENIHAGHRNRLKEEIISADITEPKSPVKLLEMLLFYGTPQKDTSKMAHDLINTFGSLAGVLEADIEDIVKISGITKNSASLIKLMLPILRTYTLQKYEFNEVLKNHTEIGRYIFGKYFAVNKECLSLLCLNRLGKVLSFEIILSGNVDSVGLSVRDVMAKAIKSNASAVVIAHNHPGGVALPSPQDVEMTRFLKEALKTISVDLLDHIIISSDDYTSMALSSQFSDIFGE